jgi:hypothetical protein
MDISIVFVVYLYLRDGFWLQNYDFCAILRRHGVAKTDLGMTKTDIEATKTDLVLQCVSLKTTGRRTGGTGRRPAGVLVRNII